MPIRKAKKKRMKTVVPHIDQDGVMRLDRATIITAITATIIIASTDAIAKWWNYYIVYNCIWLPFIISVSSIHYCHIVGRHDCFERDHYYVPSYHYFHCQLNHGNY